MLRYLRNRARLRSVMSAFGGKADIVATPLRIADARRQTISSVMVGGLLDGAEAKTAQQNLERSNVRMPVLESRARNVTVKVAIRRL